MTTTRGEAGPRFVGISRGFSSNRCARGIKYARVLPVAVGELTIASRPFNKGPQARSWAGSGVLMLCAARLLRTVSGRPSQQVAAAFWFFLRGRPGSAPPPRRPPLQPRRWRRALPSTPLRCSFDARMFCALRARGMRARWLPGAAIAPAWLCPALLLSCAAAHCHCESLLYVCNREDTWGTTHRRLQLLAKNALASHRH